jgi:prepilin-type N-terminal cleavage/methylation domain-containing protein
MHIPAPRRRRPPAGFTLVELLTVVLIIGMLVALISGAALMARNAARRAVDKTDVSQLAAAVEQYKIEHGEYPPDFAFINHNIGSASDPLRDQARADLMRHIRKRWPRYQGDLTFFVAQLNTFGLADDPTSLPSGAAVPRIYLDPASALAFWLGGLPEDAATLKPSGFHQDPTNPFKSGGPRTESFFEFKPERFVYGESDPFGGAGRGMRYYPPSAEIPAGGAVSEYAPYVYFKARRLAATNRYEYGYADTSVTPPVFTPAYYMHGPSVSVNVAVPYLDGRDPQYSDPAAMSAAAKVRTWRNQETFQVLCPGLDGQYGNLAGDPTATVDRYRYRFTRSGLNFTDQDRDNMGDFSEGALEDEVQ